MPKSLREIMCPRPSADVAVWQCSDRFTSADLYRLLVVIFGLLLGPFAFGNVQKTRALQFVTTAIRHASFGFMIVLAVLGIARGQGRSVADVLAYEKPASLTTFFGVCIYSFMCHHRCSTCPAGVGKAEPTHTALCVMRAASLVSWRRSPTSPRSASCSPRRSR